MMPNGVDSSFCAAAALVLTCQASDAVLYNLQSGQQYLCTASPVTAIPLAVCS